MDEMREIVKYGHNLRLS